MPTTTDQKVDVGVQTVAGYAASIGTLATPLIAFAADQNLPVAVQVTLIIVGAALAGITGKNRSDQKVAKTPATVVHELPQGRPTPVLPDVEAFAAALVAEVRAQSAAADELPEPDGEWKP
jgi:hypothetical protein